MQASGTERRIQPDGLVPDSARRDGGVIVRTMTPQSQPRYDSVRPVISWQSKAADWFGKDYLRSARGRASSLLVQSNTQKANVIGPSGGPLGSVHFGVSICAKTARFHSRL